MSLRDKYWLPRGGSEAERLNYQHGLLVNTTGYVIHPTIFKHLASGPRIADIGAGTAVWLLDVARSNKALFSNPQYDAFDISDEQFEKPEDELIKMGFYVQDVKDPFPERFHGQFDLIHIRFIASGVQVQEYDLVVRNLIALLRPGGAIQWQEGGWHRFRVYQPTADYPTTVLKDSLEGQMNSVGLDRLMFPPNHLANLLKECGLSGVGEDIASCDRFPKDRESYSRHLVNTWRSGLKGRNNTTNPAGPTDEEIDTRCQQMNAEIDDGAYARFDIHTFIGWKL